MRFAPRYRDLAPTLRRYRSTRLGSLRTFPGCRPANSFSRDSAAAVAGVWTRWLLTPVADLPLTEVIEVSPECGRRQTPLGCELNLLRPRYALIMIGSNDVVLGRPLGPFLATQLARVISRVRAHGTVPVLSTLPPLGEYIPGNDQIEEVNALIVHVARRLRVPLINVWRAMKGPRMINEGLGLDDVHLGAYQGDTSPEILRHSAVLTKEAIRNGANRRNLLWLQVLRRLDRVAGSGRR